MGKKDGRYAVNKKLKLCNSCGEKIAKSAKTCPHCGARNKKPFFRRIWFWIFIVIIVSAIPRMLKTDKKQYDTYRETQNKAVVSTWNRAEETQEATPVLTVDDTEEMTTVSETYTEETVPETEKILDDIVRPEFKAAMDEYEKFFDEYCEFMQKLSDSPSDMSLLMDYATYMAQYVETMEKFSALEDSEMTNAEALYYMEVSVRINQKLLTVGSSLG